MGILKLSMNSLKKDFEKSIFYFLTFLLTTIFIFSFFNLVFNPQAHINLGKNDATFVTPIAVFVILIAMICVFLANNFYVSNKSKEISVILMSGASVYQVGIYLFLQVFIIMIFAIPFGWLLGYLLIPVINSVFASTFVYDGGLFYLSKETNVATATILGFEVFWCSLLNLGYCVRSTISAILREENKVSLAGSLGFMKPFAFKQRSSAATNKIFLAFYLLPAVIFVFLKDSMSFLLVSFIGIIGVYGIIKKVIPYYIKQRQKNQSLEDPVQLMALGFFNSDMKKIFGLLLIMLLSSILLTSVTVYTLSQPLVSMVALMSYISVMILMSLTIVFKIGMELNRRQRNYLHLSYLGYCLTQLKQVVYLEMRLFYGVILVMPLIYQLIILGNLLLSGQITIYLVVMILVIQIIPILLSYGSSIRLYMSITPQGMTQQR